MIVFSLSIKGGTATQFLQWAKEQELNVLELPQNAPEDMIGFSDLKRILKRTEYGKAYLAAHHSTNNPTPTRYIQIKDKKTRWNDLYSQPAVAVSAVFTSPEACTCRIHWQGMFAHTTVMLFPIVMVGILFYETLKSPLTWGQIAGFLFGFGFFSICALLVSVPWFIKSRRKTRQLREKLRKYSVFRKDTSSSEKP